MHAITLAMGLACLGISHANALAPLVTPDLATVVDAKSWTLVHTTAARVDLDGKRAVRLTAEGDSANGIVGLEAVAACIDTSRHEKRTVHAVGDGTFIVDGRRIDRRKMMASKVPAGV